MPVSIHIPTDLLDEDTCPHPGQVAHIVQTAEKDTPLDPTRFYRFLACDTCAADYETPIRPSGRQAAWEIYPIPQPANKIRTEWHYEFGCHYIKPDGEYCRNRWTFRPDGVRSAYCTQHRRIVARDGILYPPER